jgi:hypothetical protein
VPGKIIAPICGGALNYNRCDQLHKSRFTCFQKLKVLFGDTLLIPSDIFILVSQEEFDAAYKHRDQPGEQHKHRYEVAHDRSIIVSFSLQKICENDENHSGEKQQNWKADFQCSLLSETIRPFFTTVKTGFHPRLYGISGKVATSNTTISA